MLWMPSPTVLCWKIKGVRGAWILLFTKAFASTAFAVYIQNKHQLLSHLVSVNLTAPFTPPPVGHTPSPLRVFASVFPAIPEALTPSILHMRAQKLSSATLLPQEPPPLLFPPQHLHCSYSALLQRVHLCCASARFISTSPSSLSAPECRTVSSCFVNASACSEHCLPPNGCCVHIRWTNDGINVAVTASLCDRHLCPHFLKLTMKSRIRVIIFSVLTVLAWSDSKSFNVHYNCLMQALFLFPFHRWGTWGTHHPQAETRAWDFLFKEPAHSTRPQSLTSEPPMAWKKEPREKKPMEIALSSGDYLIRVCNLLQHLPTLGQRHSRKRKGCTS